jgi:acetylornithine deacetylase
VLATEPTSLEIVHRHKGVVHAVLEASGRACHASDPGAGSNAIMSLCRAALSLEELAARLDDRRDPELGPATLSVGMMSGGQAPNVVPNHAQLWADRRLVPGEELAEVRAEIESAIRDAGVADAVALTQCTLEKPTLGTARDHPCVVRCGDALTAAGLPVVLGGVAFGTDAGVFEQAGIPGVVMGPGSIDRAHTAREYVEVDQVEAMTDFFVQLIGG